MYYRTPYKHYIVYNMAANLKINIKSGITAAKVCRYIQDFVLYGVNHDSTLTEMARGYRDYIYLYDVEIPATMKKQLDIEADFRKEGKT